MIVRQCECMNLVVGGKTNRRKSYTCSHVGHEEFLLPLRLHVVHTINLSCALYLTFTHERLLNSAVTGGLLSRRSSGKFVYKYRYSLGGCCPRLVAHM